MKNKNYPDLLAQEILKRSESFDIPISEFIADLLDREEIPGVPGSVSYRLEPHQEDAMLEAAVAINDGKRKFSLVHPGGSGKTVLEAGIIQASQAAKAKMGEESEGTKDLILTVERSLMPGVRDHIQTALGKEVGIWGMGQKDLEPDVIVATVQALQRNREKLKKTLDPSKVSLILGDEADKYLTRPRIQLLNRFSSAIKIGLTATDEWSDGRQLGLAWGEILHKMRLIEGIKRGINVPPLYYLFEADIDANQIRLAEGDYDHASLAQAMKSVEVEMAVPEIYKAMVPSNKRKAFPTMVFVPSVSTLHATEERLKNEFESEGLRISAWDGDTKNSKILAEIDSFERGELDILVLCEMGGRGLNLPRARCLIDAYPTLSLNKLEQRHSRVLRKIRPGTYLEKVGFQKGFANIAQVVPRSNSFRPATLLDVLDAYKEYEPGKLIGTGGPGNPENISNPLQEEVAEIAQNIKSHPVKSRVTLLEHVDILAEIQSFADIPRVDADGFIYLPKK